MQPKDIENMLTNEERLVLRKVLEIEKERQSIENLSGAREKQVVAEIVQAVKEVFKK